MHRLFKQTGDIGLDHVAVGGGLAGKLGLNLGWMSTVIVILWPSFSSYVST
jgi:hypothetical protein